MSETLSITSFYKFFSLEANAISAANFGLRQFMEANQVRGLIILAPEGINGTVAACTESIELFKLFLAKLYPNQKFSFKDSNSNRMPFRNIQIEIRKEIVGLKKTEIVPDSDCNHHLSAAEWHQLIKSDAPKTIIDTRNDYETKIGKFKRAIDPNLSSFSEWPNYLNENEFPKNEPVLIYCTGGIRCEKAIIEMQTRGYEKVFQLKDGILGYLAEFPNEEFEGECFVFDGRVAVDQNLNPTIQYGICPGCGLTAEIKSVCTLCFKTYFVCSACKPKRPDVCSKSCKEKLRQKVNKA